MQHRRQKARLPQLLQHQGSVLLYGARMGNQNDRTVYQQEDGSWANKRNGSERAGSVHIKQAEAIAVAKSMISKSGGGELTLRGLNGEVRAVQIEPIEALADERFERQSMQNRLRLFVFDFDHSVPGSATSQTPNVTGGRLSRAAQRILATR